MWTREELKNRAKENLRKYYWMAFLVSLIFSIVSGFGGGGNSGSISTRSNSSDYYYSQEGSGILYDLADEADKLPVAALGISEISGRASGVTGVRSAEMLSGLFSGVFLSVMLVFVVIGIVVSLFVVPAMEIGKNRFYMESRGLGLSAGVGKILWGFSHSYLNIVLTMFLRGLFIFLGTLCCVIPGIYLSYCYYMVPYILSENPDMKPMEALRLSKDMMEGNKFNTWVLELSFIGWWLLGLLACCIGGVFVRPYYDATFAELYAVLRRPYGDRLSGFGVPDVVPTNDGYGSYVNPEHVYDAGNQYGQGGGSGYGQTGGYRGGGSPYGQTGGYDPNAGYNPGNTPQEPENGGQNLQEGAGSPYSPEVSKSEGGPGNGYYLNGEFHPYNQDENKDNL